MQRSAESQVCEGGTQGWLEGPQPVLLMVQAAQDGVSQLRAADSGSCASGQEISYSSDGLIVRRQR